MNSANEPGSGIALTPHQMQISLCARHGKHQRRKTTGARGVDGAVAANYLARFYMLASQYSYHV